MSRAARGHAPDVVVHLAAYTAVDRAEARGRRVLPDQRERHRGRVARAAREVGAHLIAVSTDYVFDGDKGARLRRGRRDRPAQRLRRVEAAPASWRCAAERHDRAHVVGDGRSRARTCVHVIADARPRGRRRSASSTTRRARSPTGRRPGARAWRRSCASDPGGLWHVANARRDDVVRRRAPASAPRSGATRASPSRSPPTSSHPAPRARRPARSDLDTDEVRRAAGRPPPDWREASRPAASARSRGAP